MKRPTWAPGAIARGIALPASVADGEPVSSGPGTECLLMPRASVDNSTRQDRQESRCTWVSRIRATPRVPSMSCWNVFSLRQSTRSPVQSWDSRTTTDIGVRAAISARGRHRRRCPCLDVRAANRSNIGNPRYVEVANRCGNRALSGSSQKVARANARFLQLGVRSWSATELRCGNPRGANGQPSPAWRARAPGTTDQNQQENPEPAIRGRHPRSAAGSRTAFARRSRSTARSGWAECSKKS